MLSDILAMSCVMAFLPPQLHDRGFSSFSISVVIGVYFLMGWAGNGCLTAVQLYKLFHGTLPETSWKLVRQQLVFIILATVAMGATLALQAFRTQVAPTGSFIVIHTIARSVQGFAGAVIFYHAYIVVPVAFEDHQRTFVLTAMSMVPEVGLLAGPFIGGALYTYFGEDTTYLVMMSVPAIATILLFSMYILLPSDDKDDLEGASFAQDIAQETQVTGFNTLSKLFADPAFIRAVVCCGPPDFLKGAFHLMIPLFASVQGYSAFQIGLLPLISGFGLILLTTILGFFWTDLSQNGKRCVSALLAVSLGLVAQIIFHSYFFDQSRISWYIVLFAFGALNAIDTLGTYHISDFADKQMQPAAFGIWNSLWVLSGFLGTLCVGFAPADDWKQQQTVLMVLGIITICAGVVLARV